MTANELNELSKNLLQYGEILTDLTTEEQEGCRRMRNIKLNNHIYFYHMFNGEILEIIKLN